MVMRGTLGGKKLQSVFSWWKVVLKLCMGKSRNQGLGRSSLLEVIDDLGLFIELPDVHQPLGELPATCVNDLIPHRHLPSWVNGFLLRNSITQKLDTCREAHQRSSPCWSKTQEIKMCHPKIKAWRGDDSNLSQVSRVKQNLLFRRPWPMWRKQVPNSMPKPSHTKPTAVIVLI